MTPFRPIFPVERIAGPVLGRHGALVGVPTVEVRLAPPGSPATPLDLEGVVKEINALYAAPGAGTMPRWAWVSGHPHPHAHDLVAGFQSLLRRQVYGETDGLAPMGNIGKLPLYDHVAVVLPRLPVARLATELFHSVVAPMPRRAEHLAPLDRFLESREYNGHRFLVPASALTERDMEIVSANARLWRVSAGPLPHPGVRLSPAFARVTHKPRPRFTP